MSTCEKKFDRLCQSVKARQSERGRKKKERESEKDWEKKRKKEKDMLKREKEQSNNSPTNTTCLWPPMNSLTI